MKRVVSLLLMPVFLVALWLLLNDTWSIEQAMLGAVFSIALVLAARSLRPLRGNPKHPIIIAKLIRNVVIDITLSSIAVSRLIWLGPHRATMTPQFLKIPIELRDPHGLAMLACIVTYTPGTVWAGFSEAEGMLTLHILDLKDASRWIRIIKERYERPLKEIFE